MEFHEQFATFHTRAREQLGKRKPTFIEMQVLLCTYNDMCIYCTLSGSGLFVMCTSAMRYGVHNCNI